MIWDLCHAGLQVSQTDGALEDRLLLVRRLLATFKFSTLLLLQFLEGP